MAIFSGTGSRSVRAVGGVILTESNHSDVRARGRSAKPRFEKARLGQNM